MIRSATRFAPACGPKPASALPCRQSFGGRRPDSVGRRRGTCGERSRTMLAVVALLFCEVAAAWVTFPPAQAQATKKPAQSPKTAKTSGAKSSSATKKSGKRAQARRPRPTRARSQQAPTAERIRTVQEALARAGTYQGEASGKWDAATVEAMKSFQQGAGLEPSGKLDARTLQELGLGSPIAGQSPPRPVAAPNGSSPPRP